MESTVVQMDLLGSATVRGDMPNWPRRRVVLESATVQLDLLDFVTVRGEFAGICHSAGRFAEIGDSAE